MVSEASLSEQGFVGKVIPFIGAKVIKEKNSIQEGRSSKFEVLEYRN